jgi:succinate dehydrogenase / fumarate reductase iron-sulfur subunit
VKTRLRIRRQDGPGQPSRWEVREIHHEEGHTVLAALMERNAEVPPVSVDASCLEEACGSCLMLINGRARLACGTLLEGLADREGLVTVEPLAKFPVVRDLVVDRSRVRQDLLRVDATLAAARVENPARVQELAACVACGACLEACPNYGAANERGVPFIGAAVLHEARLANLLSVDKASRAERLEALMGGGGIADCGNVQNCVKACPKEIPLAESIAEIGRDTTVHAIKRWLFR